jgi:hypothetical protein
LISLLGSLLTTWKCIYQAILYKLQAAIKEKPEQGILGWVIEMSILYKIKSLQRLLTAGIL